MIVYFLMNQFNVYFYIYLKFLICFKEFLIKLERLLMLMYCIIKLLSFYLLLHRLFNVCMFIFLNLRILMNLKIDCSNLGLVWLGLWMGIYVHLLIYPKRIFICSSLLSSWFVDNFKGLCHVRQHKYWA